MLRSAAACTLLTMNSLLYTYLLIDHREAQVLTAPHQDFAEVCEPPLAEVELPAAQTVFNGTTLTTH